MKLMTKIVAALVVVASVAVGYKFAHAADCNSNAVVFCGAADKATLMNYVQNGDKAGHHDLAQIYYNEGRGITQSGATSIMSSNTVNGYVTKSGDVFVGNTKVASNVWSSGREFLQNSVRDGSLWMRPTQVSFVSDQIPAFVNMAGGTFHWAILKSCGNPVKQIQAPFGQIFKRVVDTTKGDTVNHDADTQDRAVEVNSGDILKYEVFITNNGTTTMSGIVMTDDLPAGVEVNGDASLRHITHNFTDIPAGGSRHVDIFVKVTQDTEGFITNQACFTANQGQQGCDVAIVHVTKTTPPPCEQTNTCKPVPCEQTNTCKPVPCTHNCQPTPPPCTNCGGGTLPTETPRTGAEDGAAGVLGFGALGYSTRAWVRSKRDLLKALKRK